MTISLQDDRCTWCSRCPHLQPVYLTWKTTLSGSVTCVTMATKRLLVSLTHFSQRTNCRLTCPVCSAYCAGCRHAHPTYIYTQRERTFTVLATVALLWSPSSKENRVKTKHADAVTLGPYWIFVVNVTIVINIHTECQVVTGSNCIF